MSNIPNTNPANEDTLSGVMADILRNFGLKQEDCIPAVVVSYDRNTNFATVKPAINMVTTDQEFIERGNISLPVFNYGGGDIIINFPLQSGNTGWIVASDRDTDLFKQNLSVSNPNTYRQHKYSFGFFIPDKVRGASISQDDNGCVVIQTLDGQTKIVLGVGKVNIKSSGVINIESTGELNIKSNSKVTVNANNVDVISGNINLGASGGQGIARIGDEVKQGNTVVGVIATGSAFVKSA